MKKLMIIMFAGFAIASCSVKKKTTESKTFDQVKSMFTSDSSRLSAKSARTMVDSSRTTRTENVQNKQDRTIDVEFNLRPGATIDRSLLAETDSTADSKFISLLFSGAISASDKIKVHISSSNAKQAQTITTQQNSIKSAENDNLAQSTGKKSQAVELTRATAHIVTKSERSSGGWQLTGVLIIIIAAILVYLVQKFSLITKFTNLFKKK